jgi:hypothetical protein
MKQFCVKKGQVQEEEVHMPRIRAWESVCRENQLRTAVSQLVAGSLWYIGHAFQQITPLAVVPEVRNLPTFMGLKFLCDPCNPSFPDQLFLTCATMTTLAESNLMKVLKY